MTPEKRLLLVQSAIFGTWLITLVVIVVVAIAKFTDHPEGFQESKSAFEKIAALITPQLALIAGFFFRVPRQRQQVLVQTADLTAVWVAVVLSLVYHLALWFCLVFGILMDRFGPTIDQAASITVWIMGILSACGSIPVINLFAGDNVTARGGRRRAAGS